MLPLMLRPPSEGGYDVLCLGAHSDDLEIGCSGTVMRWLRELAESRGVKPGVLIHATRVAVTGQAVSPGLFDVLELVGRARVLARLDEVLGARA
jgi:glutamyl/glutaminyl-tRNA synthetase